MNGRLRLAITFLSGAGLVVAVACDRRGATPAATCSVDVDCVPGSYCSDGVCAAGSDGGFPDGGTTACVSPGSQCTQDTDCCSPPCLAGGRCAGGGLGSSSGSTGTSGGTSGSSGASGNTTSGGSSGSSGTTSSGGSCQPLYGLCSFDAECCFGLACGSTGSCQ
ncbi:MAG: hypothetical protein JWP97_5250 [Labilithrix sp.]|nr:hypothetical protein [Labilithrix sp.]